MDADTRHQLKQNELAEALDTLRDFNNPTTRLTLLGLAVILAAFFAWKAWVHQQHHAQELTTQRLNQVQEAIATGDPTRMDAAIVDLRALVNDAAQPGLAAGARILLASTLADEALRKPDEQQTLFEEAITVLQPLIPDGEVPAPLQAAAMFAKASCHESLRDFDQAKPLYERLQSETRFRGSPYVGLAEDRLANLDELRTPIRFEPGSPPMPAAAMPMSGPPASAFVPPTPAAPVEPAAGDEAAKPEAAPATETTPEEPTGEPETEQPGTTTP
jgi:hypothetical protein